MAPAAVMTGADDAAAAQRLLTSALSTIFYARRSFPAHCFRTVSDRLWDDPATTHQSLLTGGKPLSRDRDQRDAVLSQGGPHVYLRNPGHPNLAAFLPHLDKILLALQQKRLGKIQICILRSKVWDANAIIEFYSLKLRYTEKGGLHICVTWGGEPGTPIPTDCDNPFKEFLRARPPIRGVFAVQPFVSSIDGQPLDNEPSSGYRKQLKQAEAVLRDKQNTSSGRIGTLVYLSEADLQDEEKGRSAIEEAKQITLVNERRHHAGELDVRQTELSMTWAERCQSPESSPKYPDWIDDVSDPFLSRPYDMNRMQQQEHDCRLSVIEEAAEDLPPTQLLPSQSTPERGWPDLGASPPAPRSSKRSRNWEAPDKFEHDAPPPKRVKVSIHSLDSSRIHKRPMSNRALPGI